ncbi:MAG: DUF481 domain-containing protein [Victivallales bacterium]|nr:DUF481 domain-containing protein [Victivallales bacterium]
MKKLLSSLMVLLATTLFVQADRITLSDGSVINGTLKSVADGKAVIATDFAGDITVATDKIAALNTTAPVQVATADGNKLSGAIETPEGGAPQMAAVALPLTSVKYLWTDGMEDPTLPQPRKWDAEFYVDIAGKTGGNTEKFNGTVGVTANLVGPDDRLKLYASTTYERQDSVTSTKKSIGGADFERKIAGTENTWYVRAELEHHTTNGLKLREELAIGYGYYILDWEHTKLRARVGAVGRCRKYVDNTHNDDFAVEAAIHFEQDIQEWGKWVTDLTYQPSTERLDDYRILHESSLDIPILFGKPLSLRVGISNEYNSKVNSGVEGLETNYFAKLVYKFK